MALLMLASLAIRDSATVRLKYIQEVQIDNGLTRFTLPTVVAPPYVPKHKQTAGEKLPAGVRVVCSLPHFETHLLICSLVCAGVCSAHGRRAVQARAHRRCDYAHRTAQSTPTCADDSLALTCERFWLSVDHFAVAHDQRHG